MKSEESRREADLVRFLDGRCEALRNRDRYLIKIIESPSENDVMPESMTRHFSIKLRAQNRPELDVWFDLKRPSV